MTDLMSDLETKYSNQNNENDLMADLTYKYQNSNIQANSNLSSRAQLLKEKKNLQNQIAHYNTKKSKWWDKKKNVFENVGNVFNKLFINGNDSSYENDKEFQELQKKYEKVSHEVENNYINNYKPATADKLIAPIVGGMARSVKGIESTANKLLGQETDNKQMLEERIAEKTRQNEKNIGWKIYQDISNSIGGMLPSMAVGGSLGTRGALTTSFGAYGGNAYNEAKREGKSEEEATKYGIAIGTLETGLEKALGGLESIYGKSALGKVSDKVMKNVIKNPSVRNTIVNMGSEGFEEYLQDVLNPVVRNITMNEKNESFITDNQGNIKLNPRKLVDEEALYSGLMGALTSGIFEGTNSVLQHTNNKQITNSVPYNVLNNDVNHQNNSDYQTKNNEMFTNNNSKKNSLYNANQNIIKNANNKLQLQPITIFNDGIIQSKTNSDSLNIDNMKQQISNTFSKQVDDVLNGTFNKNNHMTVLEHTPLVLQQLGVKDHRITLTVNKLDRIMNKNGNQKGEYHDLGEIVKKLPDALQKPLDIVKSHNNSYVLTTDLSDNQNRQIIASIRIDGKGYIDNIEIDTNVLTSAYGRNNYDNWMQKQKELGNIVYDIDRGYLEQKKPVTIPRLQLPNNSNKLSADNVSHFNTNVNSNPSSIDYSMQKGPNNVINKTMNPSEVLKSNSQLIVPAKTNKSINMPFVKNNGDILKIKVKNITNELNNNGEKIDIPYKKELRRWSETSTSSKLLKDFVAIEDLDMNKITYTKISNKQTLENARRKVSTMTYEDGLNYINAKMNDSKMDLTDLAVIDQLLVQAKQKGDYETATDLIMNKTIIGTELGQMVQQFSMIGRTTPEGQLQMYQKIIKRAKAIGDKSFEGVEITPEMVETVLKTYKNDGTYIQADLDANMEAFKQQITNQMKSTTADKINGWRYLSMLGNPKTHIRNVVSNVAMSGTMKVKNAMARTLESVFIHDGSKRTRTWRRASDDVQTFARESALELKSVIQGESKYGVSTQLKMEKKIFNNKLLDKVSKLNSNALETEDWWFSKNAYINSLQEYLMAKGITTQNQINNNKELVEQAKLYAIEQAEIATFRQYSKIANYISKIENTNGVSKVAIGATIPFKKTPINVAKTGVKYSPLGLIKTTTYDAVQLKNGNINASQFIDNLSQGMTGTSLMLLGYAFAKSGFITGDSDDDKEGKYDTQLGNQGYALKMGNNTYSLSWLSPVAMPFLMGANAYEEFENKDGWDANIVIDTLARTIDPVSEMSFISGLTDALSSYKQGSMQMLSNMAQNTASNYTMQFIPTLLSQVAGVFDDKVRSTSIDRNSSFKFGNKLTKQAMYKIPGLRNQLSVATDIWGNEKKQTTNLVERTFNSFISPFTTKKITTTPLDIELKRVYEKTGNTSVIPGIPQGYLKYDNIQYNMNSEEYTNFKKMYGSTANKYLSSLIDNEIYQKANDNTKSKMIETIYNYSKEVAKEEFFSSKNVGYVSQDLEVINELKSMNMNNNQVAEYVALKSESSTISNDKSLNATEKHQQIASKIADSNLNDEQLSYLYGKYYSSDKVLENVLSAKIPIKEFIKFNSQKFETLYTKSGKIIKNSRRNAIINYVNELDLSIPQKAILIKMNYNSYDKYDRNIIEYINSQPLSIEEKTTALKEIGFKVINGKVIIK